MNRWITIPLAAAALTACVTINVYFPAAEAKEAARQFVEKVIGEDGAVPEAEAMTLAAWPRSARAAPCPRSISIR